MHLPNGPTAMKYSTKIFYYSTVLASLFCFVVMIRYISSASVLETEYAGIPPTTLLGMAGIILYPLRNMTNETIPGVIFSLAAYTISLLFAVSGLAALDSAGMLEYVFLIEGMFWYFTYVPLLGLATVLFSFIFGWRNHGTTAAR